MKTYAEFRPTGHDCKGLGLDDRQDWLVVPCPRNRDSDCLQESNFRSALRMLGGESDTVERYSFGHWACGWFEIILVQPGTDSERIATEIETSLEHYPVLDENDWSDLEHETAQQVWRECYTEERRIKYIRENECQFSFDSMADLMGCVRGKYFAGDASSLLSE